MQDAGSSGADEVVAEREEVEEEDAAVDARGRRRSARTFACGVQHMWHRVKGVCEETGATRWVAAATTPTCAPWRIIAFSICDRAGMDFGLRPQTLPS